MELSTLAFLGFVRPNLYAWHQGWPFSLSHFLSFPFRVYECVCVCISLGTLGTEDSTPAGSCISFKLWFPRPNPPPNYLWLPLKPAGLRRPCRRCSAMGLFVGHRSLGDDTAGDCYLNLRCWKMVM